jgi:hypothetical protein
MGKGRLKERCRLELQTNFFPFKKSTKTECGSDSRIYGILQIMYYYNNTTFTQKLMSWYHQRNWASGVVVTSLWTVQGSNTSRVKRFFASPKHTDQLWGPLSFLFIGHWSSFLGLKVQGYEVNHSHPSSAKVKSEWSLYHYSPCMPSWCRN